MTFSRNDSGKLVLQEVETSMEVLDPSVSREDQNLYGDDLRDKGLFMTHFLAPYHMFLHLCSRFAFNVRSSSFFLYFHAWLKQNFEWFMAYLLRPISNREFFSRDMHFKVSNLVIYRYWNLYKIIDYLHR